MEEKKLSLSLLPAIFKMHLLVPGSWGDFKKTNHLSFHHLSGSKLRPAVTLTETEEDLTAKEISELNRKLKTIFALDWKDTVCNTSLADTPAEGNAQLLEFYLDFTLNSEDHTADIGSVKSTQRMPALSSAVWSPDQRQPGNSLPSHFILPLKK